MTATCVSPRDVLAVGKKVAGGGAGGGAAAAAAATQLPIHLRDSGNLGMTGGLIDGGGDSLQCRDMVVIVKLMMLFARVMYDRS